MEAVADLLFGLGDQGYQAQAGEAQQPRDLAGRLTSRYVSLNQEMQVTETGPDKAWRAAIVISAIKHGTDSRLVLMPQQKINNASISMLRFRTPL